MAEADLIIPEKIEHRYDYDQEYISDILRSVKTIAMVGASDDRTKFSYGVLRQLSEVGYEILPVNPSPETVEIRGLKVYRSLQEIDRALVSSTASCHFCNQSLIASNATTSLDPGAAANAPAVSAAVGAASQPPQPGDDARTAQRRQRAMGPFAGLGGLSRGGGALCRCAVRAAGRQRGGTGAARARR